jgi:homeobox-leucine zipper protein
LIYSYIYLSIGYNNVQFLLTDRRAPPPTSLRQIDMNQAPVTEREDSEEDVHACVPSSPNSTNSSSSAKRNERDQGTCEDGRLLERAGSGGISDEEDGGDGSRKKLRLSKDQSALLEESFKEHNTLNPVCLI